MVQSGSIVLQYVGAASQQGCQVGQGNVVVVVVVVVVTREPSSRRLLVVDRAL